MSMQKLDRPGRPETCVLRIDLAPEGVSLRILACGPPRKKRKGASSTSDEPVRGSDRGHAGTAGTHSDGSC